MPRFEPAVVEARVNRSNPLSPEGLVEPLSTTISSKQSRGTFWWAVAGVEACAVLEPCCRPPPRRSGVAAHHHKCCPTRRSPAQASPSHAGGPPPGSRRCGNDDRALIAGGVRNRAVTLAAGGARADGLPDRLSIIPTTARVSANSGSNVQRPCVHTHHCSSWAQAPPTESAAYRASAVQASSASSPSPALYASSAAGGLPTKPTVTRFREMINHHTPGGEGHTLRPGGGA